MRSVRDALLSVKCYTADVLGAQGAEWDVRLAQDRGEVTLDMPLAIVEGLADTAFAGASLYAELTKPMQVSCYPVPPDTAEAAILQAADVEELLQQGFRMVGVGLGHPLRVPLYDWDGVDPTAEVSDQRYDSDYLRLDNFTTTQVSNPQDQKLVRVVASFSARWRRTGRLPSGPTLESVTVNPIEVS